MMGIVQCFQGRKFHEKKLTFFQRFYTVSGGFIGQQAAHCTYHTSRCAKGGSDFFVVMCVVTPHQACMYNENMLCRPVLLLYDGFLRIMLQIQALL